jgi:hypothetical protein
MALALVFLVSILKWMVSAADEVVASNSTRPDLPCFFDDSNPWISFVREPMSMLSELRFVLVF